MGYPIIRKKPIRGLCVRPVLAGHRYAFTRALGQLLQQGAKSPAQSFVLELATSKLCVDPTLHRFIIGNILPPALSNRLVRHIAPRGLLTRNNVVSYFIYQFKYSTQPTEIDKIPVGKSKDGLTLTKLWMFCYDKVGAQASANLFSLVMTARANGVEPFEYLSEVFEKLPAATTVEAIEALLPWNLKPIFDVRKQPQARPSSFLPDYRRAARCLEA